MLSLQVVALHHRIDRAGPVAGPDNLFILAQWRGTVERAGLWVTLVICIGLIVQTLLVATGVAVLCKTSALAFTVL